MNKLMVIIVFFSGLMLNMQAQPVKLSGKIVDPAGGAIENATVTLLQPDSVFVKGDVTDAKGNFSLNMLRPGNYKLSVSFVGYRAVLLEIEQLGKNLDMGEIQLQEAAISLDAVTISASSTVNRPDRRIIVPSEAQSSVSVDAIDLLQKMQLPRLVVDPVNYTVSASGGGEVQLRLNGRQVPATELSAVHPDDIVRVEYFEEPGVRYGNAAAVINYVTLQRKTGANISANLINMPQIGAADDNVSVKVNYKKSEFSMSAYLMARTLNWTRENNETFVFPDRQLSRFEEGMPTRFKTRKLNTSLNYSLRDKDRYLFNVALRNYSVTTPNGYSDRISNIHTSGDPVPLTVNDHTENRENTPAVDIYLQHRLRNNQTLIFNVVGTFIDSKMTRLYRESKGDYLATDIFSGIKGQKYSLITEGIYENRLKTGVLTSGFTHAESRLDNRYSGDVDSKVLLNQSETYLYSECLLTVKKWSVITGIGLSRLHIRQEDTDHEKYTIRPSVRITYHINDRGFVRYQGYMAGNAPPLAYLNDVELAMDSLQVRRGNPELKPFNSYINTLSGGYNAGKVSIDLLFRHTYMHRPVMEQTLYEDGLFIRTQENQLGFHRMQTELSVKLKPWKEYLHISISPGFNRFISSGNGYSHSYNNLYLHASLMGIYKGLMLYSEIRTHNDSFMGETVSLGDNTHMLLIGFHFGIVSASAGFLCPFYSTYKTGSENWSALAPNTTTAVTRNLARTLILRLSCNLNFGREYKSEKKRTENSDSNAGIMSGEKE